MNIPKHLIKPGMTEARKKIVENFVKECRKELSKAPVFDTTDAAIEAAVQMAKKEEYSFPSVWKEPQDIGKRHAVVHKDIRESAHNAGYTQEIDDQEIFDLAHDRKDEDVEEIDEID